MRDGLYDSFSTISSGESAPNRTSAVVLSMLMLRGWEPPSDATASTTKSPSSSRAVVSKKADRGRFTGKLSGQFVLSSSKIASASSYLT